MADLNKFLKGTVGKLDVEDSNINLVRQSGKNKIIITLTLADSSYDYVNLFKVDTDSNDFVAVLGENLHQPGVNHDFQIKYNEDVETLVITSKIFLDENKVKDKHGA